MARVSLSCKCFWYVNFCICTTVVAGVLLQLPCLEDIECLSGCITASARNTSCSLGLSPKYTWWGPWHLDATSTNLWHFPAHLAFVTEGRDVPTCAVADTLTTDLESANYCRPGRCRLPRPPNYPLIYPEYPLIRTIRALLKGPWAVSFRPPKTGLPDFLTPRAEHRDEVASHTQARKVSLKCGPPNERFRV